MRVMLHMNRPLTALACGPLVGLRRCRPFVFQQQLQRLTLHHKTCLASFIRQVVVSQVLRPLQHADLAENPHEPELDSFVFMRTQRDVTAFIHFASAGGCRVLLQGLTDGSGSLKAEGKDERERRSLSHHSCSMSPEFAKTGHTLWRSLDPQRAMEPR